MTLNTETLNSLKAIAIQHNVPYELVIDIHNKQWEYLHKILSTVITDDNILTVDVLKIGRFIPTTSKKTIEQRILMNNGLIV